MFKLTKVFAQERLNGDAAPEVLEHQAIENEHFSFYTVFGISATLKFR